MVLGRFVPWAGWAEWDAVKAGLFSLDRAAQADAVDHVIAWRCRGRVPLGVDITAALMECRRRDPLHQQAGERNVAVSEMQLRLQYSMILVRMVNGISDSSQKGRVAASVLHLASNAGLPRLLVDIRHEAAHNELPTLALLRLGTDRALEWLRANYWERQAQNLITSRVRIANLVKDYVDALAAESREAQSENSLESREREPGESIASPARSQGSEGRKPARSYIGELREVAPSSSPELLADPLLDNGLLDATVIAWAAQRESAAAKPTLAQATLQQLSQAFPQLRAAVLGGAVMRILELDAARDGQNGADDKRGKDRLALLLAWVAVLCDPKPANRQGQKGKAAGKRKAGAEGAQAGEQQWRPSATQAKQLLADCLRAPATILPSGLGSLRQEALQQVLEQLKLFLPQKSRPSNDATAEPSAEAEGRERTDADSISQLRDAAQAELAAQAALLEQAVQRKGGAPGSKQHKAGRWKKVQRWLPCALGNLPSVQDSNGRASALLSEHGPFLKPV